MLVSSCFLSSSKRTIIIAIAITAAADASIPHTFTLNE